MENLEKILKNSIKKLGSISVESFFNLVLFHEKLGYYNNNNIIIGKSGDFITAPEISQIFGEVLSNVFILNSNIIEKYKFISYVEFGPGRGLLARDILRTINKISPNFFRKINDIYFLEKSNIFIKKLKELHESTHIIDDIGKVPNNFNIIVANEFFDALPINQYIFKNNAWYEINISLDENENFIFKIANNPMKFNYYFPKKPPQGYIFEYSSYMLNLLTYVCKKIASYGGIFIIIDYARNKKSKKSTLAAIKKHKKVNLFHDLGNCDISYNPDFELIKKICIEQKCNVLGPFTQSFFLQKFGINDRVDILIKNNPDKKNSLLFQKLRLIGNNYMGNIFQVFIVTDAKNKYMFI
ncbi:SAM-dependent methyltransferase [Alphaproteobacteria bacterium]|nr:SAM-dependent methyltransferase [Alphaproteobacteria bacterium]